MKTSPGDGKVPPSNVEVFSERSARFCIGIPVLNEGQRVRNQLCAMRGMKFGADVIIADGGSTDGALNSEFLRAMGVRAVLIKRGTGGLST